MVWQLLTWPAQSLIWLARQIQERAEAQMDQKENLQKELTALQIQLDLGDIDEETYTRREEEILLALEALNQVPEEDFDPIPIDASSDPSDPQNQEPVNLVEAPNHRSDQNPNGSN